MLGRLMVVCGTLAAGSAFANDSIGELGTGGIILSRTDAVSMMSENLSIGLDRVTVDYVFKNTTDKDVEALVAFPMPDIDGTIYDRTLYTGRPVGQFPRFRGERRRPAG